jgi:superfamily II DNA or RNA helicase
MLKSLTYPPHRRYKSRSEYEPVGFFSECLCSANRFDLMLGFFSTTAINVLSDGFAAFLYGGGKMRFIINDILNQEDKQAIANGENKSFLPEFDLSDLETLKNTLSERCIHFFECISYLIRSNRFEIKIISPKDGSGISHTKTGLFFDGLNYVAFDGSCNFSRTALIENIESLTVSCDWDGDIETAKIQAIKDDFENVFSENDQNVNYISAENVKTNITKNFSSKNLDELLADELRIIDKDFSSKSLPQTIVSALRKTRGKIETLIEKIKESRRPKPENPEPAAPETPRFPYPTGPRDYQKTAFENWKLNHQKGLFAMATGTGKTITSLNCLLEIYNRLGYYKAIILVPTITLVEQWDKECKKFCFNNITKICSKYSDWKSTVSTLRILESTGKPNNFVIITTYASFVRSNVFTEINSFSAKKLLLIADEAHNIGGGKMLSRLADIKYLRRIGLSATPERQYDDAGNRRIMEFFGCADSYTFEYSMREAIANGALCRYYYYPHIVKLTENEMLEYVETSKKIVRIMNYQDDKSKEILKILLLNRKRIIHKAANKKAAFRRIIEMEFAKRGNLKYTLVYVPEGNKADDDDSDIFENSDYIVDDDFSAHLIDEYTKIVRSADPHLIVRQFTAESADRDEILRSFADGSTDVLTSMKCLDEGVDVPRSELAVFCASTGNPRQFIQRRGRILRTHKDKKFATIHDLVVVPDYDMPEECFSLEKSLVEGEIKRVRDFALLSENCNETINELYEILTKYSISIF